MKGFSNRARRNERRDAAGSPLPGAKTVLIGDRRCTLGVHAVRSGVWAPSVSIDPPQPGADRQFLTCTPDQHRATVGEAMVEAERMAERFLSPSSHDPVITRALAMIGADVAPSNLTSSSRT